MAVRIDEPGNDDGVGGVDHLRLRRGLHLIADAGDLLAVDEHVASGEVAHLRVEAHDGAAAQQDGPIGGGGLAPLPFQCAGISDRRPALSLRGTREE